MADKQLVLAVFPDELAADNAAVALKDSGITEGDAVGILVLDSDGELKQDKVGARSTGTGAAIGGVLLLLGPAALGVGIIGGAAAGALHHKSLGLTDADKARLTTELTSGSSSRCAGRLRHRAGDLRSPHRARRRVRGPRAQRRGRPGCGSRCPSLIDKAGVGLQRTRQPDARQRPVDGSAVPPRVAGENL